MVGCCLTVACPPLVPGCFVWGYGLGCPRRIRGGCWCAVRAAMPVAVPAWLVHPARLRGASVLCLGAGARGCVLCWGIAGGTMPVVVCCVSCFVCVCAATYRVHAL